MKPHLVSGHPQQWVTSRRPDGGETIVSDGTRAYRIEGAARDALSALGSDAGQSLSWNTAPVWLSDSPLVGAGEPWTTEETLGAALSGQPEHCYVLCARRPAVLAAVFRHVELSAPATPVLLYGHRAIIGPTLLPRRAPCPRCWIERLLANRPALRQRVERGHLLDEGRVSPASLAGFVATVWEAPRPPLGPDHALCLNLESGSWERQRLLPRSGCRCDGMRAVDGGAIEDLAGEDLGLFRAVGDVAGAPATFSIRTVAGGEGTPAAAGSAASLDRADATRRALAEAAERLAVRDAPRLAFLATPSPADALETFAPYLPEQYAEPRFPYAPLTAGTVCRWVGAVDGETGAETNVPLQCVAPVLLVDEPRLHPASTTGIAAGVSWASAAEAALLEVAERDLATRAWYEDQLERLDGSLYAERELSALLAAGYRGALAVCRTAVPVWVLVAAVSREGASRGAYGVAAGRTLAEAASHAIEEGVLMHAHREGRGALLPLRSFDHLPRVASLPPLPPATDVAALVRHYRPRFVDLTTNSTLAVGLRVVSAFSAAAVDFPRRGEPVPRARWTPSPAALARLESGETPFTS